MKKAKTYMTVIILILTSIILKTYAQEYGSFKDSRDGHIYKTVKIGTQTWMAENLAYKASSGCWVYNNDQSNVAKYGYLYNWEAAKNACPQGWHLPSDDEWTELENLFGGRSIAGKKLKSAIGWSFFEAETYGNNESGFKALPGGYRNYNGSFFSNGRIGHWWSSTLSSSEGVWIRTLSYLNSGVDRYEHNRTNGNSVRCIKD